MNIIKLDKRNVAMPERNVKKNELTNIRRPTKHIATLGMPLDGAPHKVGCERSLHRYVPTAARSKASGSEPKGPRFESTQCTLGSSSGLKRTSFQSSQPIVTKKTFQSGPLISSFAPQTTFLTSQQPILTKKTITTKTFQSAPLISTIAAPPVEQRFIVQQQPAFEQRFAVQQVAQPAFEQRFAVQQVAQPAFEQRFTVQQVAQPAVRQLQTYAPEYQGPKWRILSQRQEVDPSGPYKWSYATENGIQAEEEGTLTNSADGPVIAAQGAFSFAGDDGKTYSVTYIADENGFRASGDHLPTPPPIPAEILKSLEENAASGERYDDEGRLLQK